MEQLGFISFVPWLLEFHIAEMYLPVIVCLYFFHQRNIFVMFKWISHTHIYSHVDFVFAIMVMCMYLYLWVYVFLIMHYIYIYIY